MLQNNGGDDLAVNGNGTFQFGSALASGAAYNVTVKTHPTSPQQSRQTLARGTSFTHPS